MAIRNRSTSVWPLLASSVAIILCLMWTFFVLQADMGYWEQRRAAIVPGCVASVYVLNLIALTNLRMAGLRWVMVVANGGILLVWLSLGVPELWWHWNLGRWFLQQLVIDLLVFLLPTSLALHEFRRQNQPCFREGHCPACGYDLRGGVSSSCSECGWNAPLTRS